MKTDIQETINHLRELDRVTAPAPWVDTINEYDPELPCLLLDANGGQVAEGEADWDIFYSNLDNTVGLLTELRNALPVLLNEIDRLNTRLATAEGRLGRVAASHPEAYLTALGGGKE